MSIICRIKERQRQMEEEKERLIKEKNEREKLHLEKLRIESLEKERKEAEDRKRKEKEKKKREEEEEKVRMEEFKRKQLEEYENNRERNIYDQIKSELAKIKDEDEKMKEKIEKERKKKSLLQQIQNEISRIKGSDANSEDNGDDGIDDETPAWLKKVISSKNKELNKHREDLSPKRNILQLDLDETNKMVVEDLYDTPSWIKIFQERSEKLKNSKVNFNVEASQVHSDIKTENDLEEDELMDIEQKKSQRMYIPLNVDYETAISQNEAIVQKSVKDLKTQLETANHKQKGEHPVVKRSEKTVVDRVRKVKSMLLDSDKRKVDEPKKAEVSKSKAKKIKTFFERPATDDEKTITKPKKAKRKFIKPLFVEETEKEPVRKTSDQKEWKWKQKSVSELYNYINTNKQHIPESITNITKDNKTKEGVSIQEEEVNDDSKEFELYISCIHDYIGQIDQDDTESCFKDTLKAYLNLIEDDSKAKKKKTKLPERKNLVLTNTSELKNRLEESFNKDSTSMKKDITVGKVDTAFLIKNEETREFSKQTVSRDLTKSIVNKYENIGTIEESRELYSMKRKLIPCKPDVDTSSWKKKQMEHQWKYKQKNIEDLQKFIQENKKEDNQNNSNCNNINQCTSIFKHIDFSQRLVDEEKKMLEFEQFMDEIHDFLESETVDEGESAFKWGIHAYMDLIEDSEAKGGVSVQYEKKPSTDKIPKLKDIKAKLETKPDIDYHDNSKEIGRLDVSSYLSSIGDNDEKADRDDHVVYNKDVNVTNRKALFESTEEEETIKDKTVVRKKLINITAHDENTVEKLPEVQYDWKYKKKDIHELQQFINRNRDIASKELAMANDKIHKRQENPDSSALLASSANLVSQIKDRDDEFEKFMSELNEYMNDKSDTMEQEAVKDNIRHYLEMIDQPSGSYRNEKLPIIGTARRVKDIKDNLTTNQQKEYMTQVNSNLIGKVSHFFKKNTNEKLNSNVIKENIASLLEPGKAKIIKANLEKKPKLKRSSSVVDMPMTKLNKGMFESDSPNTDIVPSLHSLKERQSNLKFKYAEKDKMPIKLDISKYRKSTKQEPVISQWDDYTDPEEKKKAILAKHGLKYFQRDNNEADMEDILNYESKDDMKAYEKELKQRYFLCDADDSSMDSSPEMERKKKEGSHSSLLNILNVMKKATTKSSFNETKSKVKDFGKSSSYSKSDVDLSDINKSCTDVKGLFERGDVYHKENKKSIVFDDDELAQFNTMEKRSLWENSMKSKSIQRTSSSSEIEAESVARVKEMFEKGKISKDSLQNFINSRSVIESNKSGYGEEEDRKLTIQDELEELRQSSKLKNMFRIEKGKSDKPSSLRRTNSCIGVSGERLPEDLDEEVMAEVSVTNKMVKAMFEQNAPKYKFGGSGSNLSLNGSKENLTNQGPVKRPSVKPKEERKWVLDSINKYFDVIVEEEEEADDDEDYVEDDEYYDTTDEDYDDYEEEDEEYSASGGEEDIEGTKTDNNNFQSTSKMRGLLSSVVTKISGSVGTLAQKDLMSSLKQNLGSQINLRSSNSNLLSNT